LLFKNAVVKSGRRGETSSVPSPNWKVLWTPTRRQKPAKSLDALLPNSYDMSFTSKREFLRKKRKFEQFYAIPIAKMMQFHV
jgi:hypothetical protein